MLPAENLSELQTQIIIKIIDETQLKYYITSEADKNLISG